MFRYVDLFSGCGGLSLGLEGAGGQSIFAVEKSEMAAHTYFTNFLNPGATDEEWSRHKGSSLERQLRSGLAVAELGTVLSTSQRALTDLRTDVVVGGPPCQGFSLAGRRKRDDIRNALPWQFLDFVGLTQPKAVVIENVVGMSHRFSQEEDSAFVQLQAALREIGSGYVVQGVAVNAKHYGAPQHRPRLMIIGLRSDVASTLEIGASGGTWASGYLDELDVTAIPALAPVPTIRRSGERSVAIAISDLAAHPQESMRNAEYRKELAKLSLQKRRVPTAPSPENHVARRHTPRVVQRFRLYQWFAMNDLSHRLIHDVNFASQEKLLQATGQIASRTFPAVAPDGTYLAEDVDGLIRLIQELATRKHSQKALRWGDPAKTVVTLPDDYVHPSEPRILTVRELARFQGFPDDFVFEGRETTGAHRRRFEVPQYSQVGNAVSPLLGVAVGRMLDKLLLEWASKQKDFDKAPRAIA